MTIHFINNLMGALELILPESASLLIASMLILSLIAGISLFIAYLCKKENREKIKKMLKISVSLESITNKYIYIFTDYTFILSMILVLLMSFMTERILR